MVSGRFFQFYLLNFLLNFKFVFIFLISNHFFLLNVLFLYLSTFYIISGIPYLSKDINESKFVLFIHLF